MRLQCESFDGGADDTMAIFMALHTLELEVLGLTATLEKRSHRPCHAQRLPANLARWDHTGSCVSAGGCWADRHPAEHGCNFSPLSCVLPVAGIDISMTDVLNVFDEMVTRENREASMVAVTRFRTMGNLVELLWAF